MSLFLGLDLSTQSLSSLAIDLTTGKIVLQASVSFDEELPQFKSRGGVRRDENPQRCHADPLMWVQALELLLAKMESQGFDFSQVQALSGGAQQHGTVYLNQAFGDLQDAPQGEPLSQTVKRCLSRNTCPLWMDTSTLSARNAFAEAAGGPRRVRQLSGSEPESRFAAAQIRAFAESEGEPYRKTRRIHLVSSFLSSLLIGRDAPIELGDALGMNLVNLKSRAWDETLLNASAPELREKLPRLAASNTDLGPVSTTLQERYGFSPTARVYICTGDNPSSLVGAGATAPGHVVVSLGTSDTIMATTENPDPATMDYGHIFGNPWGDTFALICFSNGSLARERVAKQLGGDWTRFEQALTNSRPGNRGQRMLPYFFPEITPQVESPGPWLFGTGSFLAWQEPEAAARAVVEAQAVLMRYYSRSLTPTPQEVTLTGGASQNPGIQQIFADVFRAPVRTLSNSASVALGAALRAAHAFQHTPASQLSATFVAPHSSRECVPQESTRETYNALEVQLVSDQKKVLPLVSPGNAS